PDLSARAEHPLAGVARELAGVDGELTGGQAQAGDRRLGDAADLLGLAALPALDVAQLSAAAARAPEARRALVRVGAGIVLEAGTERGYAGQRREVASHVGAALGLGVGQRIAAGRVTWRAGLVRLAVVRIHRHRGHRAGHV